MKHNETKALQPFGKKFEDGSSNKEDLLRLQQPKKSVLDKLLLHQKTDSKQERFTGLKHPKWTRKDLIVKIKEQG